MVAFTRLELWHILGDGLSYTMVIVPDTQPLTVEEILKICHCDSAVINIFDAITREFLGMAYCSRERTSLEIVSYGRRKSDPPITWR